MRLRRSAGARAKLLRIGRDRTPVLVVDDVLANPDEVREHALGCRFTNYRVNYYPGYTAHCALPGVGAVVGWAAREMLRSGFGLSGKKARANQLETRATFSLFAPRKDESFIHVHADGHSWLAILIYLSRDLERSSGTGFWRHRETGLESVYNGVNPLRTILSIEAAFGVRMMDRLRPILAGAPAQTYEQWAARMLKADGPARARRLERWTQTGRVAARFNRLVAYPTWLFHSLLMDRYAPPKRPADARLTFNAFVEHPAMNATGRFPSAIVPGLSSE